MNESPNNTEQVHTRLRSDSTRQPLNQENHPNPNQELVLAPIDILFQNRIYFAHNDELETENLSNASTSGSTEEMDKKLAEDKRVRTEKCLKLFYTVKTILVILAWCGIVSVIAYSFMNFIAPSTSDSKGAQYAMTEIGMLMSQLPIKKIQISPTGACDPGFEKIVVGRWAGSKEYCLCDMPLTTGLLYDCPVQAGCNYFAPLSPVDLTVWRNVSFCGLRNSDIYFTAVQTCKPNYKVCNTYYCIPDQEDCPITSIRFQGNIDNGLQANSSNPIFSIVVDRDPSQLPIVSFGLDTLGISCFGYGIVHTRPDDYISIGGRWRNCSDFLNNPAAHILDTYSELATYKQNNLQYIFAKLIGYEDSIRNQTLTLNYLTHYRLRPVAECMNINLFEYSQLYISEFNLRTSSQATLVIIFFTISIFSCTCFCCSCLVTRGGETFKFKNKSNITNDLVQILLAGGSCALLVYAIQKLNRFVIQDENYYLLASNNCFVETRINTLLLDFHRNQAPLYSQFWKPSMAIVILTCFIALISGIELVLIFRLYCKKQD